MRWITTLLLISIFFTATAKETGITLPNFFPHFGSGSPHEMSHNYIRLIGATKLVFDGNAYVPFDSVTYQYSNGRGGLLDENYSDNFAKYDLSISYLYNVANGAYTPEFRYTQTFNSLHKTLFITREHWVNDNVQWNNSLQRQYIYAPHNQQLKSCINHLWANNWYQNQSFTISYGPKGNIVEVNSVIEKNVISYDINNNIKERVEYYITGNGWIPSAKYIFTYNANNVISSYKKQQYTNGGWQDAEKVAYVLVNDFPQTKTVYTWDNNQWKPLYQNSYTYDSHQNMLTEIQSNWDNTQNSFLYFKRKEWTYNQAHQPLSYQSLMWDKTNQTWLARKGDFYYRYYYENYMPTQVDEKHFNVEHLTLFPNPAKDFLNVSLKTNQPTDYTGYIMDITGKTIKDFTIDNNSPVQVPVQDLPDGNYLLLINANGNNYTKRFLISK